MKELKNGVGIWQLLNSIVITDIISSSGFDYTLIDLEHGFFNIDSILNCVLASKASKLKTIVRLPSLSYEEIVRVIDTGIDGILFPHIENTKDLEKVSKNISKSSEKTLLIRFINKRNQPSYGTVKIK